MVLGMVAGFSGYSLPPDDVLSGNGLRVIDGLFKAIPVIGTYMSMLLFGGEFPGTQIIPPRLFTIHILLIPAMILGLIAIHLVMLVAHKHAHYPGPGRTDRNVVGFPLFPRVHREGWRLLLPRLRHHHPDLGHHGDQRGVDLRALRPPLPPRLRRLAA